MDGRDTKGKQGIRKQVSVEKRREGYKIRDARRNDGKMKAGKKTKKGRLEST